MSDRNTAGAEPRRADELAIANSDDEAVLGLLDKGTGEALRRYLATERSRNRRIVATTAGLLLCVFLIFLAIFLAVGIFAVRTKRQHGETLQALQARTGLLQNRLQVVSNRLVRVDRLYDDIDRLLDQWADFDVARTREMDAVTVDIEKIRGWLDAQTAERERLVSDLEARLRDVELVALARLADVRRDVTNLTAALARQSASMHAGQTNDAGWTMEAPLAAPSPRTDRLAGAAVLSVTGDLSDAVLDEADLFAWEESEPPQPGLRRREISVVNFPNGDRYEGEIANGLMHGWGIYIYRDGSRYDGQFRDGVKDGRGTLVTAGGGKYIGDFAADVISGRGTYAYPGGDRYVGEFANDMRNGSGTMLYAGGDKYTGGFRNGLRHGHGILRFANGDMYRGESRDGARTGKGAYYFTDGARYFGDFVEGRRHGEGRYFYANGEEYIGAFRDGLRHGVGVTVLLNGKRIKGLWEDDRMLRRIPE